MSEPRRSLEDLKMRGDFVRRHIGPGEPQIEEMLGLLEFRFDLLGIRRYIVFHIASGYRHVRQGYPGHRRIQQIKARLHHIGRYRVGK